MNFSEPQQLSDLSESQSLSELDKCHELNSWSILSYNENSLSWVWLKTTSSQLKIYKIDFSEFSFSTGNTSQQCNMLSIFKLSKVRLLSFNMLKEWFIEFQLTKPLILKKSDKFDDESVLSQSSTLWEVRSDLQNE